ncbi:hypothetical protein HOY82DRAFT_668761 [Tuber indicum]|nr:hypothetical protein HOY82DRAFT_668761 [Tuber indicum]
MPHQQPTPSVNDFLAININRLDFDVFIVERGLGTFKGNFSKNIRDLCSRMGTSFTRTGQVGSGLRGLGSHVSKMKKYWEINGDIITTICWVLTSLIAGGYVTLQLVQEFLEIRKGGMP